MKKLELALIGCGAIGTAIAKAVARREVPAAIEYIFDINRKSAENVRQCLKKKPKIASVEEILRSNVSLVIEAASQDAVRQYAEKTLEAKKNLMLMSIGALADEELYNRLKKIAGENNVKIYLPSGAIGSLDALKSAAIGKIKSVTLTTTKHPRALKEAPFFEEKGIDARSIAQRTMLFDGSAAEAVKKFPMNVNVAMALSIAGIGAKNTRVIVVADPEAEANVHEIYVEGEFGEYFFKTRNLPFPDNPRTSYLAALSAIATLKRIISSIEAGN